MDNKNKSIHEELNVMWRKSIRRCLGLAKCCPNDFIARLVGTIGNWATKMSKKIIYKIKNRLHSPL